MTLGEFLTDVAAGHAPPAAGSVAAATVALSASLCAMTARLSRRQFAPATAGELTAEAQRLSEQAAVQIQADAEAVRQALAGTAAAAAAADSMPAEAALAPMQILELATQVARLAARLAAGGNRKLRGDALCARLLAEGAARAAAALAEIDLAGTPPDDPRLRRISQLRDDAARQPTARQPTAYAR
jgi:formiminotetrahydrofolate cyclodeaminase